MASWVICPCGNQVSTGPFPEPGTYKIVSGDDYDAIVDPIDRVKLDVFVLRGRALIECPHCGRILIRERGGQQYTSYAREPD